MVEAIIDFGRHRKGDVWTMVCRKCAMKLIREGKVKRVYKTK